MMSLRKSFGLALLLVCPAGFCIQESGQEPAKSPAKLEVVRPHPDSQGNYSVGKDVLPPKLIYSVEPLFTNKARHKKFNGSSLVSLVIDTDGNPQEVSLARSIADTVSPKLRSSVVGLDESAVKAVQQYRFEPASLEGQPVPVRINVEVHFNIF